MMIVCQAFINMSVVTSLLPTKGIPLPFISSGGSSLLISLLAVGVLLNISQHGREAYYFVVMFAVVLQVKTPVNLLRCDERWSRACQNLQSHSAFSLLAEEPEATSIQELPSQERSGDDIRVLTSCLSARSGVWR